MTGIYDSGLGGLTVLARLRALLPKADILYFGDTAHLPYGSRSAPRILSYAEEALRFFCDAGVDVLLTACGTVSTVAKDALAARAPFPVIGIDEACISLCRDAKRIAVLGTAATVRTGKFPYLLRRAHPHAEVRQLPCPLFVSLAENGITDPADPAVRTLVPRILSPLASFAPDTVLLACTHFPIFESSILDFFGTQTRLIDCGKAAAEHLAMSGLCKEGRGKTLYFVSDAPDRFRETAKHFFPIPEDAEIGLALSDPIL